MVHTPLSIMSSFSIAFVLLVVVTNVYGNKAMVSASSLNPANQTELIRKACVETLEPIICSQCLRTEHSRQFDDITGFIYSLLSCMLSNTTQALEKADSLAAEKDTSPALKRTLSSCSSNLNGAIQELQHALFSMKSGIHSEAWKYSVSARRMVFRCTFSFHKNPDFTIPTSLLAPMVQSRRLCDAAYLMFLLIVG